MTENAPDAADEAENNLDEVRMTAKDLFWSRDLATLKPWRAMPLLMLRILHGVVRDIRGGQLTMRAMSLVYTTLLATVPLLAISFSVLKGLGAHNEIEPFLLGVLAPLGTMAPEIASTVVGFVDQMQLRVLGFIGVVFLFYTVISLIQKIEGAFNYVWQISHQRTLTQRFRDYLSVVVVGPVLVFASFGMMAGLMQSDTITSLVTVQPFGWLFSFFSWLAPTAFIVLAFTFVYWFVPNIKVRMESALLGGVVSGVLWNAIGWAFASYVVTLPSYVEVYSGFASPLIFLIWLYLSWLILLVGTSIAYYHQNAQYLPIDRNPKEMSSRTRDRLSLATICLVGERYYTRERGPTQAELARRLGVPGTALAGVLRWLGEGGFVTESADSPPRYLPACPWETVTLDKVLMSVHQAGKAGSADGVASEFEPMVADIFTRLDQTLTDAVGDISLKDLATSRLDG